ncbi:MAG: YggW family oxidoreductase [Gammaproteobacteria bacterium]|nr:YggW family oxidoreductase [Gammaproteobacteria bacterium]
MLDEAGLYIHYPWCVKKCPYCDFNSHPIKGEVDQQAYCTALFADWETQKRPGDYFHSVFFGGGTPSLMHPQNVGQLLAALPINPNAEITLEVNPGTHEYMDFADSRKSGVNRLSIGAQSFDDKQLHNLGRVHQSDEIIVAFGKARAAGFENINLDVMWGLPEQTVAEALQDLQRAIELQPEHISWYQLTIEAKTEFARRTPILPVEQIAYEIETAGLELLAAHGFKRYEISAFAQSGQQCRHNLNYWQFGDYLGLGAGAHGKRSPADWSNKTERPKRISKASQPRLYLADPNASTEHLIDPDALALEFMMNALRLVDGVEWALFEHRTGLTKNDIEAQWSQLQTNELVATTHCGTTKKGLRYLDSILQAFI